MPFRLPALFSQSGHAATFLKAYVVGGVLILLVGFVLYSQWILHRLEEDNRALIPPLARLTSYYPSIDDRETSRLVQEIVARVTTRGRIQFVITDSIGTPLLARGVDQTVDRKLSEDEPLTADEERMVRDAVANMEQAAQEPIPVEYLSRDRRIIGYIYHGDVDPSLLADIPIALTDILDHPVAWRIYGDWETPATHAESIRRVEQFVRESKRKQRVKALQISPPAKTGLFYYALRPLPALQWMPVIQIMLVAGFVGGGVMLYRRLQADEQAAIWAGLAKESAHQLGTPLTSLFGWIDVARDTHPVDAASRVPELYDEMEKDLVRLQRIVTRFSQVGHAPTRSNIDPNSVVREAAAYFRQRLPSRAVQVEILEAYESVPNVYANQELLQWVIENLIRNALDAMDDAGVSPGRIELTTVYDQSRDCVIIRVGDNGTGIPRRLRKRVFTPGFTTKKRGWGVGLTLARRIVESYHNGRIRLADYDASGATFEVTLPAEPD